MAMTLEQKKALAIASARLRAQGRKSASDQFNELPWYAKAGQAADDTVRMLANGITLGYADKFAGYMGGEGTDAERAKTAEAQERAGSAGTAAEIIGMMAPASALGKSAISATRYIPQGVEGAKGLLLRSLGMGADGAMLGAAQATGHDQDVAQGAALGAIGGAGGNVLGEGVSAGISKLAGLLNRRPPVMSAEQLKKAGTDAYNRAEQAGVVFKPEAIQRLQKSTYDDMAEFGFHPKNQPGASVAYDELARLAEGGNVSLKGLDTARKVASGGFAPQNPSNNALISKITERIDDFATNAKPEDVLTGDVASANKALGEARDYWGRFRKTEKVNELLDRAGLNSGSTGSGGNVENATRQQLKRILTDKKMMRGFTPDERAAVRKAVLGTPTQNVLRLAGKLSPQGNGLMAALGLGGAAAGLPGAVPAMLGGMGAKKLSETMTARNAEMVKKLIASGGSKAALEGAPNAVQRLAQSKRDALVRILMSTGLVTSRGE